MTFLTFFHYANLLASSSNLDNYLHFNFYLPITFIYSYSLLFTLILDKLMLALNEKINSHTFTLCSLIYSPFFILRYCRRFYPPPPLIFQLLEINGSLCISDGISYEEYSRNRHFYHHLHRGPI